MPALHADHGRVLPPPCISYLFPAGQSLRVLVIYLTAHPFSRAISFNLSSDSLVGRVGAGLSEVILLLFGGFLVLFLSSLIFETPNLLLSFLSITFPGASVESFHRSLFFLKNFEVGKWEFLSPPEMITFAHIRADEMLFPFDDDIKLFFLDARLLLFLFGGLRLLCHQTIPFSVSINSYNPHRP